MKKPLSHSLVDLGFPIEATDARRTFREARPASHVAGLWEQDKKTLEGWHSWLYFHEKSEVQHSVASVPFSLLKKP